LAGVPGPPLESPEDLTAEWLGETLRSAGVLEPTASIGAWSAQPIGTGQMSQNHRVTLIYDGDPLGGPATVVLKVASPDANSRATGVGLGAYEREVRFYREIAPTLGGPLARCFDAAIDAQTGYFHVLLEDLDPATQGDQIAGCSVESAALAVDALAELQGERWDDPELLAAGWLNAGTPLNQGLLAAVLPGFVERYEARIAPEHLQLSRDFIALADAWLAHAPRPHGIVHGDYRLDNMLFAGAQPGPDPGAGRPVVIVDWQTVACGPPLLDLSYFLGGSLTVEDRRAGEEELVRRYHAGLLAAGVTGFDWETCWAEYRRTVFHGVVMAIAASMLVVRTERGDDMFMTTLARHAQQALDLESLSLIDPSASLPALVPEPEDEGRHAPGPEELWNESWYFDFTTTEDGPAGYTRLGLYPNRDEAWITLALVQRGAPTVEVVDFAAPPPGEGDLSVTTSELEADHVCVEPLQRFGVRYTATGRRYAEPAAILRGEPGEPVEVEVDLTWETDGTPYQYRIATRYEIPCRVTGTITIDGQVRAIDGHGQRDHSWGARDWWSMDWCWSAARLDDGTRLHAVELRLPDTPRIGVGYVQTGGEVSELKSVAVDERVGDDGLVEGAAMRIDPPELDLELTALADGPLLLTADDGRTAHFPRSMCRFDAADGRTGLGWAEWNLNQPG
jgi:hypothetical protein